MYGKIRIITNKKVRNIAAKPVYNAICVLNELGQYETLLLTENDLDIARMRAMKNPEDCVELSSLARAAVWLLRILRII
jgi:hypothetical protein